MVELDRSACGKQKMACVLKITVVLVICFTPVECKKDIVFCVICEKGLKANRSLIRSRFRSVCGP